jgi:hypothetical protein
MNFSSHRYRAVTPDLESEQHLQQVAVTFSGASQVRIDQLAACSMVTHTLATSILQPQFGPAALQVHKLKGQ